MPEVPASRRPTVYYAAAAAILALYVAHCVTFNYVVDDAFITFRYVDNFVHGHGLVYNVGERVEGYTNFLWTMLLSLVALVSPRVNLLTAAQVLGVAFGAATILLTFRFGRVTNRKVGAFSLIAPVLLATSTTYVAWSTGGLETMLYAFLLLLASFLYLRSRETDQSSLVTPVLFALAAMTRPDGMLFFGVVSIHFLISELRMGRSVFSRRMMAWVLPFAAVFVPYFLWRLSYYGYPVPNTFYAKVGGGSTELVRGLKYLGQYLVKYGGLAVVLPLPFLWKRRSEQWVKLLSAQLLVYLMYVAYVGGDGLAYQRFLAPIAPLLFLMAQEAMRTGYEWVDQSQSRTVAQVAVAACCLWMVGAATLGAKPSAGPLLFPDSSRWYEEQSELSFPGNGTDHGYLNFDNYFVERQRLAAEWLDANVPKGSLLAATPAGSIAYYSHLPVIDMLGLNDVHIAHFGHGGRSWSRAGHEKGDGKYVLSRSPDFILLGNVAVLPRALSDEEMSHKLVRTSEDEIWADPGFHRQYELVAVKLNEQGVFRYFMFYKKKSVSLAIPKYVSQATNH